MKKVVLYIGVVLLAIACSGKESVNSNSFASGFELEENASYDVSDAKALKISGNGMKGSNIHQVEAVSVDRKLIKKGNISFETKEMDSTRKSILEVVGKYKGYVARDNQYKSHDRVSATISVRIPARTFDAVLATIAKGAEKVDAKNVYISDVTEQFLDVQVRLKTKKALEIKYLEILKKARTVREILDVERELAKLRGDIEANEGRLKYLKNQVAFSTLDITFYKLLTESEVGFGSKIIEALNEGVVNVKDFFVSLLSVWPFVVVILLLVYYIKRKIKSTKS